MNQSKKQTVNDLISLDIRSLNRAGLLKEGEPFTCRWWKENVLGEIYGEKTMGGILHEGAIRFVYDYSFLNEPTKELTYDVALSWTRCNYGGKRPWFVCPGCYRRAAILYLSRSGYLICRRCADLTYTTCQESGNPFNENLRRQQRIKDKLGWQDFSLAEFYQLRLYQIKPRYMHNKKFYPLLAELKRLQRLERAELGLNTK